MPANSNSNVVQSVLTLVGIIITVVGVGYFVYRNIRPTNNAPDNNESSGNSALTNNQDQSYPKTLDDGSIVECSKYSDDGKTCETEDITYSIYGLRNSLDATNHEVKVRALASFEQGTCTQTDPPQCDGHVMLRDLGQTGKIGMINNITIQNFSGDLKCTTGSDGKRKCNSPFEIGKEYDFIGTLNSAVPTEETDTRVLERFVISKYDLVK